MQDKLTLSPTDLIKDLEAVKRISIIPSMLEVICQTTGMGFAAVARVTSERWVACSVRDEIQFGLKEGGELQLETTICNEIRDHKTPVVIDHVDEHDHFKNHHTPKMYGFQSYISVPIMLKNGTFFGTLCAIDPKPARLNNSKIIGTFVMFADLLSFHLQSLELLDQSYNSTVALTNKNRLLKRTNKDLDNFVYTASHDLKSPVSNIEGLITLFSNAVEQENLDKQKLKQIAGLMKTSVQRLAVTIHDLSTIVESDVASSESDEAINVLEVVESVKEDLFDQIKECDAHIEVACHENFLVRFRRKNFRSIIYNLLSNAIKYSSPERRPKVQIMAHESDGKSILSVKDNGLGIPSEKKGDLFSIFKRFHNHVEGSGVGLFLVKRLVENANGQILVESEENEGTTFTVVF